MHEETQSPHKLKMARCFIKATQELIDAEGIENISIRKIAHKAGFHNSTIYLYFENVDQLILLASLHYFTEYKKELTKCSMDAVSTKQKFLSIWEAFGRSVFEQPKIFYNFFFGKYSQDLTIIIRRYYTLFPEEKPVYPKDIEDMYYGNSIQERCYLTLSPLIGTDHVRFSEENIDLVNTIIVGCFRQLLELQCEDPSIDAGKSNRLLLDMISYITGIE